MGIWLIVDKKFLHINISMTFVDRSYDDSGLEFVGLCYLVNDSTY